MRAMPEAATAKKPGRPLLEILGVAAGMVVFALFSHRALPWIFLSIAGLLIAAAALERSLRSAPGVAGSLGLAGFSGKIGLITILGCAIGVGGGLLHRQSLGLPLAPAGLERFAIVACLIGGVIAGLLRQSSGSAIPPMAAHAAFDLIVYGALARSPWWVWG
jgi:hypothetical protein